MSKKTYTTFEVGEICGVYPTTVINWVNQSKLPAFATPGGHRRIRREDLVAFLAKYNFPTPPELLGGRRRVLVVDDDPDCAGMIRRAFQAHEEQFEVSEIHNGIEALVSIGRTPPDLVVLDVVMPIVDGGTVCATLRKNPDTRAIKILAITGKRMDDRAVQSIRSHADGLFQKPFKVEALVKRALELLRIAPVRR
jgi:two-component system, OmpR family, response regulator RpaA